MSLMTEEARAGRDSSAFRREVILCWGKVFL